MSTDRYYVSGAPGTRTELLVEELAAEYYEITGHVSSADIVATVALYLTLGGRSPTGLPY